MLDIPTTQLMVARVLRDNPDLRHIRHREKIWLKLRNQDQTVKFSTVERCCRHIQNSLKMYLPDENDGRYVAEQDFREYFGGEA